MFFNAQQDLKIKRVSGDLVLYDPSNGDVHMLNATAANVFQLCDGLHTPEEITKALVESFDGVDYAQAYEDVKSALDTLEAKNLVVRLDR
jgi:PqqD family protein of HPr-rel-A system